MTASGSSAPNFNSRSCEGATLTLSVADPSQINFNSRSCEGATLSDLLLSDCVQISTHAPVKERRGGPHRPLADVEHFNSRSCEGATAMIHQRGGCN